MAHPYVDEAVVVSTCARTEVYLWTNEDVEPARAAAHDALLDLNEECGPFITSKTDADAVRHLFRIAAGLESQVVGEHEIAGQVRSAYKTSRGREAMGVHLDALFRAASACSRRLRRETSLGATETSVAAAAAAHYRLRHGQRRSHVLVIGSGRVARMLVSEFRAEHDVVITARSLESLEAVADRLDVPWLRLPEALARLAAFDVICCATRSRQPLVTAADVRTAAPLVIFDVSIPRNVDATVAGFPGITLYDVDDVGSDTSDTKALDSTLIDSILDAEVHDCVSRETYREIAPIISALRAHVDRVREQELDRIRGRLDSLDEGARSIIESLTARLIDRMFHHLVTRLKLASLSDPDLIRAAEFFFAHGEDSLFPAPESPDRREARQEQTDLAPRVDPKAAVGASTRDA
jgi:glutamyl-tRNA reductase